MMCRPGVINPYKINFQDDVASLRLRVFVAVNWVVGPKRWRGSERRFPAQHIADNMRRYVKSVPRFAMRYGYSEAVRVA